MDTKEIEDASQVKRESDSYSIPGDLKSRFNEYLDKNKLVKSRILEQLIRSYLDATEADNKKS